MRNWITYVLAFIIFIVSNIVAAPFLVRYIGRTVGWYLRHRTSTRRDLVLARVKVEEDDFESKEKRSRKSEDDDWERVESYAAGIAKNGEKADDDWQGVVGFFHPFWYVKHIWNLRYLLALIHGHSNAGGGGERVLWAAIRATQKRWPRTVCVVYTGDHDVDKAAILERVKVGPDLCSPILTVIEQLLTGDVKEPL